MTFAAYRVCRSIKKPYTGYPSYLNMHAEKADVGSLLLLEGKHGPRPVGEVVQHLSGIHVPAPRNSFNEI